jgi:membrane protease YdiL (CAAX protease family)
MESFHALDFLDDVVTSPIEEEILFRGLFLSIFLQHFKTRPWLAVLLSAVLFGAYHGSTSVLPLLTIIGAGLLLGCGYLWTWSVPFCVVCHAVWNGLCYTPWSELF